MAHFVCSFLVTEELYKQLLQSNISVSTYWQIQHKRWFKKNINKKNSWQILSVWSQIYFKLFQYHISSVPPYWKTQYTRWTKKNKKSTNKQKQLVEYVCKFLVPPL